MYTTQGEFLGREPFAAPAPAATGCPVCTCPTVAAAQAAPAPAPAPAPSTLTAFAAALFAPAPAAKPPTAAPAPAPAPAAKPPTAAPAPAPAAKAPTAAPAPAPAAKAPTAAPVPAPVTAAPPLVDEGGITSQTGAFYAFHNLYPALNVNEKLDLRALLYNVKSNMQANAPQFMLLQNAINAASSRFGPDKITKYVALVDESDIMNTQGDYYKLMVVYSRYLNPNDQLTLRQRIWGVKMSLAGNPNKDLIIDQVMIQLPFIQSIPQINEGELMTSPLFQVFKNFYSTLSQNDKLLFRNLCFDVKMNTPPNPVMMLQAIRPVAINMFGPSANAIHPMV